MMFDDVAQSVLNPFPGKIFNRATAKGQAGADVYRGCQIDYRGHAVTARLFRAVLEGNKTAAAQEVARGAALDAAAGIPGSSSSSSSSATAPPATNDDDGLPVNATKVLTSTAADAVFVNFIDHGAAGLVALPSGPSLKRKELQATLVAMRATGMYGKLVFYMEACNSGSMFGGLDPKLGVFATTAANATEPSWGTFCPPANDFVDGAELYTCLGDLYSVNWMEDAEAQSAAAAVAAAPAAAAATAAGARAASETLQQQFELVRRETNLSHVLEFGDASMRTNPISDFLGGGAAGAAGGTTGGAGERPPPPPPGGSVDSRDIPLVLKFYSYLRGAPGASRAEHARTLVAELAHREAVDATFGALAAAVDGAVAAAAVSPAEDDECFDGVLDLALERCVRLPRWTDYSLKYSSVVSGLCRRVGPRAISDAILRACA